MRCPQECRLCPEKVLTDDDKRPCGGTQRTGAGREGSDFIWNAQCSPGKPRTPKAGSRSWDRPGTGRHVCLLRKHAGLSLSL